MARKATQLWLLGSAAMLGALAALVFTDGASRRDAFAVGARSGGAHGVPVVQVGGLAGGHPQDGFGPLPPGTLDPGDDSAEGDGAEDDPLRIDGLELESGDRDGGGAGADRAPLRPRRADLFVSLAPSGPGSRSRGRDRARIRSSALQFDPDAPDDDSDDDDEAEDEEDPVGVGLRGSYWKFIDETVATFPEVTGRPPDVSRIDAQIAFAPHNTFDLPFVARNIFVQWRGFLFAAEDGVYTLTLGSDDGSRLTLDGQTLLAQDRLQPFREVTVEVVLTRGFHSLDIEYFQNEGAAGCVLSWVPPTGDPGPIPTHALFPAERVPTDEVPRILSVGPPRKRTGEAVTIEGEGFPGPLEPFEVLFGDRPMAAHVTESGAIVATIPPGLDRGEIFVRLRETTSEGFPYEVGGVFGLLGSHWVSEEQITTFAEMPGGTPDFQRVVAPIEANSGGAFNLPFPVTQVAIVYEGQLFAPRSGPLRLALDSDDGSRLFVNNAQVLDNGGLHGRTRREATVELAEGFNAIRLDYFQNHGGASVRLLWDRGEGGNLVTVPRGSLTPPTGVDLEAVPRITQLTPAEAPLGALVSIDGEGFGFNASATRVLLRGRELPIESMSDLHLSVRLPNDARTGDLIVQRGAIVSEPAELVVLGSGLHAAFYRFDTNVQTLPNFATLPIERERIVPELHFGEGFSFELPYESQRFGAVFTGTIDAPVDGAYAFFLLSDDGSRLLVDGRPVVDNDGLHGHRQRSGTIELIAGARDIRVEFFQNEGAASLDLHWVVPGQPRRRVPSRSLFPPP